MRFTIFGREPSAIIGVIGAVLAFLVTYNIDGLSELQAAAIMGVLVTLVAVVNALFVRPIAPAVFSGLVAAGAGLAAAYGFTFTPEQIATFDAIVLAVLSLASTRPQVSPSTPDPR